MTQAKQGEPDERLIWLDGAIVPWSAGQVHLLSQTLQHGFGAFEGVRAYETPDGPAIFRLQDHSRRLLNSAKMLALTVPWSIEQIDEACLEVVRVNRMNACYLRPVIFLGAEQPGVSAFGNSVHLAVMAWPWRDYMGTTAKEKGIRLKVSSYSRNHIGSSLTKAKCNGLYVNSMLAHQEARLVGFDDALMLDVHGHIAEASTSNLFVIRGGEIATPPREAILEGITRDTVIRLFSDMGLSVEERAITRDELFVADEAFLTGTAAELTPIREVDGRVLKQCPGPLFEQASNAFAAETGSIGRWMTPVLPPNAAEATKISAPLMPSSQIPESNTP